MNHGASAGLPLTPRRAPEAYVRAEIASFPLASLGAFRDAIVLLDPQLGLERNEEENKTRRLWISCENELGQHASGWSLDRLVMARDFFWFGCKGGAPPSATRCPSSLRHYLLQLSDVYVEPYPGSTVLRQSFDANAFDATTHYRWLTFALPEDLLLAATDQEPAPRRLNVERPLLLQYLSDRGAVEVHHHIGGGMSFSMLWASAMARLAGASLRPKDGDSPHLLLESGERLLRWLLAAAITRVVLAEFLVRSAAAGAPLDEFLERLVQGCGWSVPRIHTLRQALRALSLGAASELPDFYDLRELYMQLHPGALSLEEKPPESVDEVWRRCDPISCRLGLKQENGGERWLLRHGLRYLKRYDEDASLRGEELLSFETLFWQVQRVRCLWYRTVVQRPLTAGLQWFVRFYSRLDWARRPLQSARAEVSYNVAGRGRRLSALEVRITPEPSSFKLATHLLDLTRSWTHVLSKSGGGHGADEPEFGVILHFVKERDPKRTWAEGAPLAGERGTYAEPRLLGRRFEDFFTQRIKEARAAAELFQALPQLLWLVRGVDITSDELAEPTWLVIPLFRHVHHAAALASASPEAEDAPELRLTAHVGEDFRHLMEGLRRIFECVLYQLERFGGRLGHAVALGIEPRLWAESTGSVMMPTEDRLLDLIFEWRLYSGYRIGAELRAQAPPGRPEQVENAIRELSRNIFGPGKSYAPQTLAEVHHILHRLFSRPESRLPAEAGGLEAFSLVLQALNTEHLREPREVIEILSRYQQDQGVFQRGQALVDVTLDESEVEALYAVQNALRRGVSRRNIVVEVNPSSNLLIGDLMDLRNHPILRLFPPELQEGAPPPVPIAVGSDDPVTFSTWLLHEYSLLYEAAVAAGYTDRVAHTWLEKIQRIGMDARFTVRWRPSGMQRAQKLCEALEDYLLKPHSHPLGDHLGASP